MRFEYHFIFIAVIIAFLVGYYIAPRNTYLSVNDCNVHYERGYENGVAAITTPYYSSTSNLISYENGLDAEMLKCADKYKNNSKKVAKCQKKVAKKHDVEWDNGFDEIAWGSTRRIIYNKNGTGR